MAKGQSSKAATVVTSQDLVQPLVAVSVQSAQLRQKLQAVHDEYQKKQLHLVRQLAASTTTVSSSVQGGYNCRVSCFELDMLDFRKLQAVHDEFQKKQLHLASPPTGYQYYNCFYLAQYKVVTIIEFQASNQIVVVDLDIIFQTFSWL